MEEKYVAGVDPGMLGAICVMSSDGKLRGKWIFNKSSSGGIDLHQLSCLIWSVEETWHPAWWLEEVHSIFGAGKGSMFKLGENLGILKGMLQAHGCNWNSITPKNWQKAVIAAEDIVLKDPKAKRKIRDTKATALLAIKRLYPNENLCFGDNEKKTGRRTKPHGGIVDSILIARSQLNTI